MPRLHPLSLKRLHTPNLPGFMMHDSRSRDGVLAIECSRDLAAGFVQWRLEGQRRVRVWSIRSGAWRYYTVDPDGLWRIDRTHKGPPPWHPLGVRWTGSAWVPYASPAPEARHIYACVERFCEPPWGHERPRHEICEVSGPGWRGFLRALRPYLLRGYTVRGGIGWSDIMNAGRDSAGN